MAEPDSLQGGVIHKKFNYISQPSGREMIAVRPASFDLHHVTGYHKHNYVTVVK